MLNKNIIENDKLVDNYQIAYITFISKDGSASQIFEIANYFSQLNPELKKIYDNSTTRTYNEWCCDKDFTFQEIRDPNFFLVSSYSRSSKLSFGAFRFSGANATRFFNMYINNQIPFDLTIERLELEFPKYLYIDGCIEKFQEFENLGFNVQKDSSGLFSVVHIAHKMKDNNPRKSDLMLRAAISSEEKERFLSFEIKGKLINKLNKKILAQEFSGFESLLNKELGGFVGALPKISFINDYMLIASPGFLKARAEKETPKKSCVSKKKKPKQVESVSLVKVSPSKPETGFVLVENSSKTEKDSVLADNTSLVKESRIFINGQDYTRQELIDYLSNHAIPGISIDYITFVFQDNKEALRFLEHLRGLHPDLSVFDVNARAKLEFNSPADDFIIKNFGNEETKYCEARQGYHAVILLKREGKPDEHTIVGIPSTFSNQVTFWNFTDKLDLSQFAVTQSRIDLKMDCLDSTFLEYWHNRNLLIEFIKAQQELLKRKGLQKKTPAFMISGKYDYKFAKAYIGKRTSRKFLRFYISESRQIIRAELEIKKHGLKQKDQEDNPIPYKFSPCFIRKDLFGFNKQIILNVFESFQYLAETSFSRPLIEWYNKVIKPIKDFLFPDEYLLKRGNIINSCPENSLVIKKPTIDALQNSYKYGLHLLMIEALRQKEDGRLVTESKDGFFYLNRKRANSLAHRVLMLVFFTKTLRQKWETELSEREFKFKIGKAAWNHVDIENEVFKNGKDYHIRFDLKELAVFLNLGYNTKTKLYIQSLLGELFRIPIPFCVGPVHYMQHLIHSLDVDKTRGRKATVGLILHPFAVYNLLDSSIFFSKEFMLRYYEKVRSCYPNSTEIPSFAHFAFITTLQAIEENSSELLKQVIRVRDHHHSKNRQKQGSIHYFLIDQALKEFPFELYVKHVEKPLRHVTEADFNSMFYSHNDSIVDETHFIFRNLETSYLENSETLNLEISETLKFENSETSEEW